MTKIQAVNFETELQGQPPPFGQYRLRISEAIDSLRLCMPPRMRQACWAMNGSVTTEGAMSFNRASLPEMAYACRNGVHSMGSSGANPWLKASLPTRSTSAQ